MTDRARGRAESQGSLDQLVAPPIFVVGHHRSGTTWVFDLLTHPDDVAGVFESWLFTTELGLGGLLHWGHWDPEHVERIVEIFGRRAGIGQLADHDEVRAACRALVEDWLSRALGPQHRYLVEKSPDHLYAALAISDVFPEARFVNVVRDGRDVAVSVRAARSWAPGAMSERLTSVREIGRRWRNAMVVSSTLAERLGSRYHQVSYEHLKAHPQQVAEEIYRFCGLDHGDDVIRAALHATEFDANYEGGKDHFRRAGRTGDWRRTMSLLDRYMFGRGSGDALQRFGYARSRWWWLRPKERSGSARV